MFDKPDDLFGLLAFPSDNHRNLHHLAISCISNEGAMCFPTKWKVETLKSQSPR